jgi:hypothetical protein
MIHMNHMAILVGTALVAAPSLIRAQTPEYQLRFLTHAQWTPPGAKVGIAGWAVLPNVMNESDPWRTLLLGGALLRGERRWVELMAGALVSELGSPTYELDVRWLERLSWAAFFLEAEYNFGQERLFIITNGTVPLRLGALRLRAGIEGEWVHSPVSDVAIAGPRITIALPLCGGWCRDAAITTAYRMQSNGHRVVRQYVGVNF